MWKQGVWHRALVVIIAVALLSACVTLPPNSTRSPQDPWESWNRGVYKFNDALDRAVAKPVAQSLRARSTPAHPYGSQQFLRELEHPDGHDQ